MGAYFERLSKDGGFDYQVYKVHSDLEATNIIDSLGESNPYISKKLKEYAISGGNYLQFLQTISNQGTGLNWQSYIRGLYNTRYIRGYVEKDYSISSYDTLKSSTPSTSQNANSLDNVRQYLASSRASELDLLDVAPFTNLNWSETNLSNGTNDAENRYGEKIVKQIIDAIKSEKKVLKHTNIYDFRNILKRLKLTKYNKNIPNMNRILVNNKKIGWDIKSNGSIIVSPPENHEIQIKDLIKKVLRESF